MWGDYSCALKVSRRGTCVHTLCTAADGDNIGRCADMGTIASYHLTLGPSAFVLLFLNLDIPFAQNLGIFFPTAQGK